MAVSTNSSNNKTVKQSDFLIHFLPIRQLPRLPTAKAAGNRWRKRTSLSFAMSG